MFYELKFNLAVSITLVSEDTSLSMYNLTVLTDIILHWTLLSAMIKEAIDWDGEKAQWM